jgi:ATP-binding cassette subfamily B protein
MPPAGGAEGEDGEFEDLQEGVDRPMVHVFSEYGRDHLGVFVFGALASIVARGFELLPALVLGTAIDAVLFERNPFNLLIVPQSWIPEGRLAQFWLAVGLILAAYVFGAALNWANSWAWNYFAQHLQHEVRVDTYDVMQRLEMGFFDDRQTGEVMSILNNDVNQLESFLTNDLNGGVRIVVLVLGVGTIMFLLNWQLAIVGLASVPVLMGMSYLFVQRIQPKYRDVRQSVGDLNSRLENNIGGIEVIKSYSNEGYETDRVEGASREYLDANWGAITTRIKFFPALRVVTGAGFILTFIVGGYWVIFGPPAPFTMSLTVGTLVTMLLYSRRFLWPMRRFGQIVNNFEYARAAAARIVGLMDDPNTMSEDEDPVDFGGVEGRVTYDDVSFSYSGEDEPVLRDVDFEAEPGELVGLVGPTGAGKTTLMKLLLRFYDPDSGSVRIDGVDVQDASLESLRESIGYVSQEPFLFHGTVRDNIAYGVREADDEEILAAARTAGALEFIDELPEGLDTMVGERGVKLSGGQRQRVSIARAVLKDPDILVLDEATSHVDNETEVLIKDSLDDLIADRTAFAIAHRLSTVRGADSILVLDDGELVEEGTHEDLLAAGGLYANLWSVQVGEVENLPEEFVERAAERQARTGLGDD